MVNLTPEYFKTLLKEIYSPKEDFSLVLTHQKPKTRMGTYNPILKRIRIHDGWGDEDLCTEIAIHEFAHHIHYAEKNCRHNGEKPHGKEFWMIYYTLLTRAIQKGLYSEERINDLVR